MDDTIRVLSMSEKIEDGDELMDGKIKVKCKCCGESFAIDGEEAAASLYEGYVCEGCKPEYDKQQAAAELASQNQAGNQEAADTIAAALGQ